MHLLLHVLFWLAGLYAFHGIGFVCNRLWPKHNLQSLVWSASFALSVLCVTLPATGWGPRRLLLCVLVVTWSVRLCVHLATRLRNAWATPSRYRSGLSWPDVHLRFASVALLSAPYFWIAYNPAVGLGIFELIGPILWLAAITAEAVADLQLAGHAHLENRKSPVCDTGLWAYSRHPNYFFETLAWLGFAVMAMGSPWGWTAVVSPAAMLWLLLVVTGIPQSEADALRRYENDYRDYQRRVSKFIPWFPRKN